jgi:hypothetical protein
MTSPRPPATRALASSRVSVGGFDRAVTIPNLPAPVLPRELRDSDLKPLRLSVVGSLNDRIDEMMATRLQ